MSSPLILEARHFAELVWVQFQHRYVHDAHYGALDAHEDVGQDGEVARLRSEEATPTTQEKVLFLFGFLCAFGGQLQPQVLFNLGEALRNVSETFGHRVQELNRACLHLI